MKKTVTLWLALTLLVQVQAASVPEPGVVSPHNDAGKSNPTHPRFPAKRVYKPTLFQKAAARSLEHKLQRKLKKSDDGDVKHKRTLGLISLICGILGIALLPVLSTVSVFLLPAALITGILGVSNNKDKRSRTHSIIGLVLGGVGVFLTLLALIYIATFGWL